MTRIFSPLGLLLIFAAICAVASAADMVWG